MFCINVYCFPKNASCQFIIQSQGHQPDMCPHQQRQNLSIHHPGGGAAGTVGKSPMLQAGSGSLELQERQRAGSGEVSPSHRLDPVAVSRAGRGCLSTPLCGSTQALQGSEWG